MMRECTALHRCRLIKILSMPIKRCLCRYYRKSKHTAHNECALHCFNTIDSSKDRIFGHSNGSTRKPLKEMREKSVEFQFTRHSKRIYSKSSGKERKYNVRFSVQMASDDSSFEKITSITTIYVPLVLELRRIFSFSLMRVRVKMDSHFHFVLWFASLHVVLFRPYTMPCLNAQWHFSLICLFIIFNFYFCFG